MADYKIQLGVQLDSKAQENINNQLRKIETKIETATLSKKAISSIQDQLKSANLGITIDTTSIKKAQNEVNKLVDSVRKASGLALGFGDPSNPMINITSVAVSMIFGIILNVILKDKKKAIEK